MLEIFEMYWKIDKQWPETENDTVQVLTQIAKTIDQCQIDIDGKQKC